MDALQHKIASSPLAYWLNAVFDWVEHNRFIVFGHLLLLSSLGFWLLVSTTPRPPSTAAPHTPPNDPNDPRAFGKMAAEQGAAPAVAAQGAKKANPFQAPDVQLDPPKNDPFTVEELSAYDGKDPGKPIYVAIKGTIFDVSAKREMYGPGAGYNVFAGKDGSRALGKSSLKPEDAVADYSVLDEKEQKVLDDWLVYFKKRYNIVGRVVS